MAKFGSVYNLVVSIALMSIHVGPAASQACEPDDCDSLRNCQNANNALVKLVANDSVSLNTTVYRSLKTNVTTYKDVTDFLNGYWSTFSTFDAKLTAYSKTAEYKAYVGSIPQRDKAACYQKNLTRVLTEINASVPTMQTATATNATTKSMTDLYGETSYVCGQFKSFLVSWKKYCGCPDQRKRRNSKNATTKKNGRLGRKDRKFTTKKANKVTEARKGKGKKNNKGKGKGKKNKSQS